MVRADVLVVGAGPAGSSLAARLARTGLKVLLVDAAAFPRAKPCAECLSPAALPLLQEAGLLDRVLDPATARIDGFRVTSPGGRCLEGRYGTAGGIAIRREVFDLRLIEGAVDMGATLRERHRLVGLDMHPAGFGRIAELRAPGGLIRVRAEVVVGADGTRSQTARLAGLLRPTPVWLRHTALVSHHTAALPHDPIGEIGLADGFYAGLAAVGDGLLNTNLVVPAGRPLPGRNGLHEFFVDRLDRIVGWRDLLRSGRPEGPLLVSGPLYLEPGTVVDDHLLLVGDAAGYIDPLTGEGIYLALESSTQAAVAIGAAFEAGRFDRMALAPYQRARRRTWLPRRRLSALLQAVIRRPWLADGLIGWTGRRSALADRLVQTAGDLLRPGDLLGPRGWRYLIVRPPG